MLNKHLLYIVKLLLYLVKPDLQLVTNICIYDN